MPAFSGVKTVAEVVLQGSVASGGGGTKPFVNVFHFIRTNPASTWDNAQIANGFIATILPDIVAALSDDYATQVVKVRCLDDAEDPYVEVSNTSPGVITGDRLTDFSAACMILKTNKRGKAYQGRKHFGPFAESDVGEDIFNAGCLGRLDTIKATILAGFTSSGGAVMVPAVFSPSKSTTDENPTTIVANQVVSIAVNKTIGTMRGRKVATVRA